jgi:pimeloyl-ACP methyl ester carboxylesterase
VKPRSITAPDGRTLTVREGGDPDGVPVLVIAGTPGSSLMYEPHLRDAEQRGLRLFSYDRPGYGGSTRNAGRVVADCAADVVSVCDALGIERFCVWGVSGGGPHALATAALLPERVAAAASLASIAPFGAEGLDFYEGMGAQNVEEFGVIFEGDEAHRAVLERDRQELLAASPEQLVEAWNTLLGPADRAVLTGRFAAFVLEHSRAGIERSLDGWFDDDVAFSRPWGFELGSIRVPVALWQGEQDKFVPFGHGVWLSRHIPGVEPHLTADDGHLTLGERRIPEVHEWLLARYAQADASVA